MVPVLYTDCGSDKGRNILWSGAKLTQQLSFRKNSSSYTSKPFSYDHCVGYCRPHISNTAVS